MCRTLLVLLHLLCPMVVLASRPQAKASLGATVKPKESPHSPQALNASILKRNGSSHPAFDSSIFHSNHPAFPFLLPGKTAPMEAKNKMHFSRMCFRFVYAVTVNVTNNDDPAFFNNLFNLECVGGDRKTCNRWSDELLKAVRKKMQVVKLLGKDGHIGRSKKLTSDQEFEAHLPPTMTGVTSYAKWCNELYKDLTMPSNKTETEVATTVPTEAVTLKAVQKSEPTNATKTPVTKDAKKTSNMTVVPAKAKPQEAKPKDGCVCIHRGGKEHCSCDKESSETAPFKGIATQLKKVATQLKGQHIAEQASKAAGNDKDLDALEGMMHKARTASSSISNDHRKKTILKKF